MLPTMRAGEGLLIDPDIAKQPLVPGDVIVFASPNGKGNKIVHRIVKTHGNGYRTRGDNNRKADTEVVAHDSVIGRVVAVRRGAETVPLLNGAQGRLLSRRLLIKKYARMYLLKFPVLISKIIERSRILNMFHSVLKLDVIRIKKRGGFQEILLCRHRLIGKRDRAGGTWRIRFPYKYFINKDRLC